MILRRLGIGLVSMLAVSLIIFAGTEVLPGDVAEAVLGQSATSENLAALRRELGLNEPAVLRYFNWLAGIVTGDFGMSLTARQPVWLMMQERLNNTLLLAGLTALIAVPFAVTLGLTAAMAPNSMWDRSVSIGSLCVISVPEFFLATMFVLLFSVTLDWLPSQARVVEYDGLGDLLLSLAMPILTLTAAITAHMTRMTRATVLNVMTSPYIEMAILKGATRKRIVLYHALPNALGPIANVIVLNLAYLFSGVVVVETIFNYPGLARLTVDAVGKRDMPLVQGCVMVFAFAYVVLILLSDLASIVANPKLRRGS